MDEINDNGNGKRGLPRLKYGMNRPERQDSDCGLDILDLDFVYADSDLHINEIAELYSYTEQPEFQLNVKAFEEIMELYDLNPNWQRLSDEKRRCVIVKLLDQLEVSDKTLRMQAARCILYLAQGCWAEVQSDKEQMLKTRENVVLLYNLGAFHAFIDLLNLEIDNNSNSGSATIRKCAVSLVDSTELRVILSVLYIFVEVIRCMQEDDCEEHRRIIEGFKYDISNPIGDSLITIKLFTMVTKFCGGTASHFPMKKVLLLLWKTILLSLGGMEELWDLKQNYRQEAGLPSHDKDTMEVVRSMRASSPPASAADVIEGQSNQKRYHRPFRRSLIKQSTLGELMGIESEPLDQQEADEDLREFEERQAIGTPPPPGQIPSPRPLTPVPSTAKGLPWLPKVRQKDLDNFLETTRIKFVGFPLHNDRESLFGLPQPIHEGVRILKQHMYTSLSEIQVNLEEELIRNPISKKEILKPANATEILYQAMFPNLPQYMIALLKILLAAAPTSKSKSDSINIMVDVLPEEMPMTVLQSMKLSTDVNRHKEIIVKAVSGILLLLLKHFKINHVYQFEFMSQHLVFANCIPLVLKFFNQNIMAYVSARNVIPIMDFPSCVIGDQPELTAENLEVGDNQQQYSWRNLFACINLLRILNKLTKWKHSRIMMLVVFKSAPILKRSLKVRHAMMQLYVLKLLKMQTKYLGRQWRKTNMKTMSAIYQKVRHRLNDDWAFGNDLDAKPWDFQAEESALRSSVDRFNARRYSNNPDPDYEPVDNCSNSVLGRHIELTEEFKKYYHLWLQQEVFQSQIKWEELLVPSYL